MRHAGRHENLLTRDQRAGGQNALALSRGCEHHGRGPIKAKTYVLDNLIVCLLSDGFTAIERTMMEGGEPDSVLEMRRDFQRMMKERYTEMIEALTPLAFRWVAPAGWR